MKTDIREYSNEELSLNFMNDEGLYNILQNASSFNEVKEFTDEIFIYTDEQLEDLEETWQNEQDEE